MKKKSRKRLKLVADVILAAAVAIMKTRKKKFAPQKAVMTLTALVINSKTTQVSGKTFAKRKKELNLALEKNEKERGKRSPYF